ncbi:MAG: radical SAM protein [bacterium]
MALRKKVLFLQLPQIDNDLHGDTENIPLAAAYLQYAAEQEGASPTHEFIHLPESATAYDNPNLLSVMVNLKPDIIVCTLYLWNIERTVRMMQEFRTLQPTVRILFGGPEAAMSHPFLFKRPIADAIVVGEGETVFPALLRSFKTRQPVNFSTVAIRTPKGYRWGTRLPAPVRLSHQIPPPGYEACRPDAKGMAYLETSRGCPRHCTYCRYPHLRRSMSFLEPDDILSQIAALLKLGAREIRFVDPTFNAHPRFRDILLRLAAFNRKGSLSFFAELNAERVTDEEADLLAKARFVDIEVGVQSRDATVLKAIRRPTSLIRLDAGIKRLTRRRIRTTVDIMYGLPTQRLKDVRQSLNWALKLRHANIQCLQTLLLPGTELRERRAEWRIQSQALPPYAVTKTSSMDTDDFLSVERMIAQRPKLRSDVPTPRFVGRKLDLFAEQIRVPIPGQGPIPGTQNRRAFLFTGVDLFARRKAIAHFIKRTIRDLPDNLFQFVLIPEAEEPLDLLDELIAVIRRHPSHLIDRYACVALENKIVSRRLMVQLPQDRSLSREWADEAETILSAAFF